MASPNADTSPDGARGGSTGIALASRDDSGPRPSASGGASAGGDATPSEGAQLKEPEILPDGTKLFELVVDEIEWEVEPGKFVDALAYNGQIPGPTLTAEIGDKVTIRVVNNLDAHGTSLHPRGLCDHDFAIDGVTCISQAPIAMGDSMDCSFVADQLSVASRRREHPHPPQPTCRHHKEV